MSWRQCRVIGCRNMVREGLRRTGVGIDGQALADGETCSRCRAKQARKRIPRKREGVADRVEFRRRRS
jgi:hypothetical protein